MARYTEEKDFEQILSEYIHSNTVAIDALASTSQTTIREVANLVSFTNNIQKIGTELGKIIGANSISLVSNSILEFEQKFTTKLIDLGSLVARTIQAQVKHEETLTKITNALLLVADNQEKISDRLSSEIAEKDKRIARLEAAMIFIFEAQQQAAQQAAKK